MGPPKGLKFQQRRVPPCPLRGKPQVKAQGLQVFWKCPVCERHWFSFALVCPGFTTKKLGTGFPSTTLWLVSGPLQAPVMEFPTSEVHLCLLHPGRCEHQSRQGTEGSMGRVANAGKSQRKKRHKEGHKARKTKSNKHKSKRRRAEVRKA